MSGHKDIVNILLKCNNNVNQCMADGSTPLHFACIDGNIDIVNILLKYNSSHIDSPYYYTPVSC
jgi:ankyrin repeat protein